MTDFSEDDVAAMRRDGSLRELLRMQIADGAAKRDAKPKPVQPQPPGHQPGAWPRGTSPPGPPPQHPPAAWQTAVDEYRDSHAGTDRPDQDSRRYRCECGACPREGGTPDGPRS